MEEINARFKSIRLELKMSQKELSESLGVTTQSISDIERGINGLSMKLFAQLVDKHGVNPYFVLRGRLPMIADTPNNDDDVAKSITDQRISELEDRVDELRALYKYLQSKLGSGH